MFRGLLSKTVALASLLVFVVSSSEGLDRAKRNAGECEPNWKYLNKNCYFAVFTKMTWPKAVAHCTDQGAILAAVKSAQQGLDVLQTQANSGSFSYWIGVKSIGETLEFTDGKPSTFRNWASAMAKPTIEKQCVRANRMTFGSAPASWYADACEHTLPFTCQKRAIELGDVTLTYKTPLPDTPGVTMVCDIDYPKGYEANFDVEWYVNGQLLKKERIKGKENRESYLKSGHDFDQNKNEFKAGDTLQCKVKACRGSSCTPQGNQADSNKYFVGMKVVPGNYFELDECTQKTIKVQLVPTVPIRCTREADKFCRNHETEYGVRVNVDHDEKVVVSDCFADFDQNEDPDASKFTLDIVPVCDNVNGNGDEFHVTFRKIATSHPFWKDYQPERVTIKLSDKNTKISQCYCNDDPHCKTLDGRGVEYHGTGTFIMYRNIRGDYEVHIKTRRCGGASCTCAAAVRYEDVSVVIDSCGGTMNYYTRPHGKALPEGMVVERNCGGHNCRMLVITPNGNKITFNKNGRWHQFYVDAHMEQGECRTEADGKPCGGLCGKFNGDSSDDYTTSYGTRTSNVNVFGNSWSIRPDESYFMKDPEPIQMTPDQEHPLPHKTCQCNANPVTCEYNWINFIDPLNAGAEDITKEIQKGEGAKLHTRRSFIRPQQKRETRGFTTFTTQQAEKLCHEAVYGSALGQACSKLEKFTNKLKQMKRNCVFDLKVSREMSVVASTKDLLIEECEFEAISVADNRASHHGLTPNAGVLENLCEGDCSGHGQCHKGKCVCDEGYTSQDCSINLKVPPSLDENNLGPGRCDVRTEDCSSETLVGSDFLKNPTCHLEVQDRLISGDGKKTSVKTAGHQVGVFQVRCALPRVDLPARIHIRVSNNGVLKSKDAAQVFVYDSACQLCDLQSAKCSIQPGKCFIAGRCYDAEARNSKISLQSCRPEKSQTEWTDDYEFVGCFKDKTDARSLGKLLENMRRKDMDWEKMSLLVDKCAQLANKSGFQYFALQFIGECYSDNDAKAKSRYAKYGKSSAYKSGTDSLGRKYHVGDAGTNCVYKNLY